jgi:hypothetical protein
MRELRHPPLRLTGVMYTDGESDAKKRETEEDNEPHKKRRKVGRHIKHAIGNA